MTAPTPVLDPFAADLPLDENDVEETDEMETETPADPSAPFGRFKSGRPRKAPAGSRSKNGPKAPSAGRPKMVRPTASKNAAYYAKRVDNILDPIAKALVGFSPVDGLIIQSTAPNIAEAWGKLAEAEPVVAKFLDGGGKSSIWAGAIMSVAMPMLMIGAAHNMLPPIADRMVRAQVNEIAEYVATQTKMQEAQQAQSQNVAA